ncbi:GNAT family N-acetyltransferase [Longispora sp. K20-0274]|uniref:GNAT family N-acetyltransferase n=1 Tax=Longispora sp. K20-0274 TaxID=3088255 RepID=UPI00399A07D8
MSSVFPTGPLALDGEGVVLREWDDADLPTMVELFDESEVDVWTPLRSPFDLAAAGEYLGNARRNRLAGDGIQLAITSGGPAALGEVLLFRAGADSPDGELAYAVGAAHRRRGLAGRAVRLITGYALGDLGMPRVILRIDDANVASVGVARTCGFVRTDAEPVVRERKNRRTVLTTWECR